MRRCIALVMGLLLVALTVSADTLRAAPESWPVFRGDGGLAGAAPARIASPLKLRWVFRTGAPIVSSAVIADDTIGAPVRNTQRSLSGMRCGQGPRRRDRHRRNARATGAARSVSAVAPRGAAP